MTGGGERRARTTEEGKREGGKESRYGEKKRERNELKPLPALALGLKSSEGFLLARHLTKQLEVNPFPPGPSILFLRIYDPKLRRLLTPQWHSVFIGGRFDSTFDSISISHRCVDMS